MSENTATAKAEESAKPTKAELAEIFKSLPTEFQQAITDLNKATDEHNTKVDAIKSAEAKDPKLIKAEIYEQNPKGNKKLARIREQEVKLLEQVEQLRKQAYEIIDTDGLMPKELSEDELTKLKEETSKSAKELKDRAIAFGEFEKMLPNLKDKLLIHVHEVKTRRGTGKSTTATGGGEVKRPRFKKIEVNGVTEDDRGNKVYGVVDGNPKYTFTFAAQYLSKQHKGFKVSANDLTQAYFGDKQSQDDLPDVVTFTIPYTYKNEGGHDVTINYEVKAYK